MPQRKKRSGDFKIRRAQRKVTSPGIAVKPGVDLDGREAQNGCLKKRKYKSKQRASFAAHAVERRTSKKCAFYHCRTCGFFHVTSQQPRDLKATVSRLEMNNGDADSEAR